MEEGPFSQQCTPYPKETTGRKKMKIRENEITKENENKILPFVREKFFSLFKILIYNIPLFPPPSCILHFLIFHSFRERTQEFLNLHLYDFELHTLDFSSRKELFTF